MKTILNLIRSKEVEHSGSYKPDSIRGEVEFQNVYFAYPSKPNIMVLKNLNFKIKMG